VRSIRATLEDFIREHVKKSKANGVIIGLSGGLDSAVVSKLCCDALGSENVLNFYIPSDTSLDRDFRDARDLCNLTGAELQVINICQVMDAFQSILPNMDQGDMAGNVMARCRMIILYHHARINGRVVMGTTNKSERMIGYFTKFGDGGADFYPLGSLYKTEVIKLAYEIGVPRNIINKAPSAGLWRDQTDEVDIGMSYDELDKILICIGKGLDDESIASNTSISKEKISRARSMYINSMHKRQMPPVPTLTNQDL